MNLQRTAYLVLASLQGEERHGYAIRNWMIDAAPDERPVPIATLYATIERLEADGCIELHSEAVVDGRARRMYRLTAAGGDALHAEALRLRAAADLVALNPPRRTARAPHTPRAPRIRPAAPR